MTATRLLGFSQVAIALLMVTEILTSSTLAEPPSIKLTSITIQVEALDGIHPASNLDVRTDPQVCGKLRSPQSVLLDSERHLKNVVVWLEGANTKPWAPRNSALENRQTIVEEHCEFSPRIVIIPPDGIVSLFNRDNIIHGLRSKGQLNPPSNRVHPPNLNEVKLKFAKPEIVPVACDFHPWMKAFVVVAPHSHYGVTDASGRWTFADVAPGTYKLRLWHEILGARTMPEDLQVSNHALSIKIPWGLIPDEVPAEAPKKLEKKK